MFVHESPLFQMVQLQLENIVDKLSERERVDARYQANDYVDSVLREIERDHLDKEEIFTEEIAKLVDEGCLRVRGHHPGRAFWAFYAAKRYFRML